MITRAVNGTMEFGMLPVVAMTGSSAALMAAVALLARTPTPSEDQIRTGLAGNLCRCTGYVKIFDAVAAAAGEETTG